MQELSFSSVPLICGLMSKTLCKHCKHRVLAIMVELGRIELPSESALTQTSPGADGYSGLSPAFLAIAQTITRLWFSSFIIHGAGKAYRAHVLH